MLKLEKGIAVAGADGQSGYYDLGDFVSLQTPAAAITAAATALLLPLQIIAPIDQQLAGGMSAGNDLYVSGNAVQRLNGVNALFLTAQAAAANLTLGAVVYRNFGIGVALANGVAITSITPQYPLLAPLANGQTFVVTNATGTTFTATTSAAVPAGAAVIPINSATPAALFPVGSKAVMLVGNTLAFGYIAPATGTPAFAPNTSYALPAVAANIALTTPLNTNIPYLQLCPTDFVAGYVQTSSSTFVMSIGLLQSLIV
jgi:hypothetical protein